MESCVVSLSEILKSVFTEMHYYLSMGTNKLETVQIFEGIGVWTHLISYCVVSAVLLFIVYVWIKTRARAGGGIG